MSIFSRVRFALIIGLALAGCSSDDSADASPSGATDAAPSAGAGGLGGGEPDASAATDAASQDLDASDAAMVPSTSTGPGDWVAGDYPPDLSAQTYLEIADVPGQNGLTRQYKVHVPPSYDPEVPMPLVFCLHGLGQNAVMFCVDVAGVPAKADAEGFIVVMPNGHDNSWNAGTCCGGASTMELDDVALVRAIFEEVGTHLNVDLGRVYATGLSNGGYLSYRLACEASDIFVAVAPGSGAIGKNDIGGGTNAASDFTTCEPTDAVSILALHGDADVLISYSLVEPSLNHFAEANGCSLTTGPTVVPAQGGDTSCVSYIGCPDGIELTGCTVAGGGHIWFGAPNDAIAGIGADSTFLVNTDAAWEFFKRLSR